MGEVGTREVVVGWRSQYDFFWVDRRDNNNHGKDKQNSRSSNPIHDVRLELGLLGKSISHYSLNAHFSNLTKILGGEKTLAITLWFAFIWTT